MGHWSITWRKKQTICNYLFRDWEEASLFQDGPDYIYEVTLIDTWKLPSATTVWSAGRWAAPPEQLRLGVLLRGTSVVVMNEGKALLFHFPHTDLSSLVNRTEQATSRSQGCFSNLSSVQIIGTEKSSTYTDSQRDRLDNGTVLYNFILKIILLFAWLYQPFLAS